MALRVIQGASNVFQVREDSPTTNYSDSTVLTIGKVSTVYRGIGVFDFSAIPARAVITSAVLSIYCTAEYSMTGYSVYADRIVRNDVNLSQMTWNVYKTGSDWGTAGCSNATTDYTTTNEASASVATGWVAITVTDMAKDAQTSANKILSVRLTSSEATEGRYAAYHSSYYSTDTSLRPKLAVTTQEGLVMLF